MIKIEEIYGDNYHFITTYPDNQYIEKTIAYGCETDDSRKVIRMGRLEVYLRSGGLYTFECYVGSVYCSQFGIQVSHDGQYVYVISDEKGLWCYTYKGEVVWKTRYTSVSYVIPHPNHYVTCVTTTRLMILDTTGKIVKKVPIYHSMSKMASDSTIVSYTSNSIIAVIDGISLETLYKISLKVLGFDYINHVRLNNDILEIKGFSCQEDRAFTVCVDLKNDPALIPMKNKI